MRLLLLFIDFAPLPLLFTHNSNVCSYRYEGLGVKEIRAYLDEYHPEVYMYLPEPSLELPKVPKAWIANVCATIL